MLQRLNFKIDIQAPAKRVWKTMLEDESYRIWTAVFMEGSHFQGDWSQGSKIIFLGPSEDGKFSGMVSRIEENRPYEYICIEHLGFYHDGVEDTTSEEARSMAGVREIYSLQEKDGITQLKIEMDTSEEYVKMMDDIWPKALQIVKEIAEGK